MADGSMTPDEREAFLADLHVAVLAVEEPGRGPLAVPIWYEVEDGEVVMTMAATSVKARLLAAAGRATVTVQQEAPPYRYVSVEGPVALVPGPRDVLPMATRYLGAELGQWYADEYPGSDADVTVRLRPERWRTYDYAKVL